MTGQMRDVLGGLRGKVQTVGAVGMSLALLLCLLWTPFAESQVSVTTSRYDSQRDGLNDNESFLNPANVTSLLFGKLFTYNVDGYVAAQPLYVPNVSIPGQGTHNVVYVATQHDSVFAFDADNLSPTPLWSVSFINPAQGITTVPISTQGCQPVNQYTEIGIMGTPVIDPASGTIYVAAKTQTVSGGTTTYRWTLHALDITTGQEKFGGPQVILGSVQSIAGQLFFSATGHMQRPGLLLSNGSVYVAFGSNGCDRNARGWVMAYNASNIQQQTGIFNTAPNQSWGSSIWMSGSGLGADSSGNVYFASANGAFDANTGGPDYGDSIVKLTPGANGLTVGDYFTPYDQSYLQNNDVDLGSGGVTLLPDQSGAVPHLLVQSGKEGTIYLINRDNMGHYNPNNNSQIVQSIPSALGELHSAPVFWNNTVYFAALHDALKGFAFNNGQLSTTPTIESRVINVVGAPTISANGNTNGLLWIVRYNSDGSGMFSAFNASTLAENYNTNQVTGRDTLGFVTHFVTPTVANGKVYVGSETQLVVYGLFPELVVTSGNGQSGTVGTMLSAPLTVTATNPYTGGGIAGVSVSCSDGGKGGSFGSPTGTTNSSGGFSTTYTLPQVAQTVGIACSSTGLTTALFSVTAVPGSPASLAYVQGNQQSAPVGTVLPGSLAIKVQDAFKNGVPGVQVTFSDGGAGGSFSANPVTTDASGRAVVSYTLPTKKGILNITASYGSLTPVKFVEQGLAGSPATLSIASGNGQTAPPNTPLPNPLAVLVLDSYGNGVPGITASFTDNGAGGHFSSNTAITNNNGRAAVTYTTPGVSGIVTITASAANLTPVNFSENVQ